MSPRRNHPRRRADGRPPDPSLDDEQVRRGVEAVQTHADGEWLVRNVSRRGSHQELPLPGLRPGDSARAYAHLVAWPADERGGLGDRRHWHTGCWKSRDRRAPGIQRSRSAPRYG